MSIFDFVVSALVIGMIISILAVIAERVLISFGLARGDTLGLIAGAFLLSALRQLLDSDGSLWLYSLFFIVVAPLTVNRSDIIATMRKGRWWWKPENENKGR